MLFRLWPGLRAALVAGFHVGVRVLVGEVVGRFLPVLGGRLGVAEIAVVVAS
jgi:hypothetical protein